MIIRDRKEFEALLYELEMKFQDKINMCFDGAFDHGCNGVGVYVNIKNLKDIFSKLKNMYWENALKYEVEKLNALLKKKAIQNAK